MLPAVTSANRLSVAPMLLEVFADARRFGGKQDEFLGCGTGFLVGAMDGVGDAIVDAFLVTAGHVFTGRHPDTGEQRAPGYDPDYVLVHYVDREGAWVLPRKERYDLRTPAADVRSPGARGNQDVTDGTDGTDGTVKDDDDEDAAWIEPAPLWVEHPGGPRVDIAALHIGRVPEDVHCLPVDVEESSWPRLRDVVDAGRHGLPPVDVPDVLLPVRVTDRAFVVGFPFGDQGTWPWAIWSTVYLASEPAVAHHGLPRILVDGRTREGQSGAPVFLRLRAGEQLSHGGTPLPVKDDVAVFLGVYSGRMTKESDLGLVWTADAVRELLDEAVRRQEGRED